MLTPEQKLEVEKRLKIMETQKQAEKKIKQITKFNTKKINQLIISLKEDPKAQRNLLNLLNSKIGSQSINLEKLVHTFENAESGMKADKDHFNKQKLQALEEKQKMQLIVEEIKDTIKKIQETVSSSIKEEAVKRLRISEDLEKSLDQIKSKIVAFENEARQMEIENQALKIKMKQIQEKMAVLQINFKLRAQQKDNQVKKQKQELMGKLQNLQSEVSEVTEINKELSNVQKSNFDKKLSLYLKIKKFPEFSTSFQNSAKTIDQCKQQIFKGVQRMNDAKDIVQKCDKQVKEHGNNYLLQLKKKTEKQGKIESIKKQKQKVRERIINLQNKLKEQKNKPVLE